MPSLESDLIEILRGTMEADMGTYTPGSIKVKDIDKALMALNQVNLDKKDRKTVKDDLRIAGRDLFGGPPDEDINDEKWKQWSLKTNLASCCFSIVFPNLAIGLSEWCDPAVNAKRVDPPEKPDKVNQVLSLWATYNLALAYKDTKSGTDRTEERLLRIAKPDLKRYPDFEKSKDKIFEAARAALQWQSLIQLCEIHKDRQEKTRFEEKRDKLLELIVIDLKPDCNREECKKVDCILFSTLQKSTDNLIEKYKSYIAGSLFLLCQEYQILSMRANCRKKDKDQDRAVLIAMQGQRVSKAIDYINKDSEDSPLKVLKNTLYLIALMYINEALQSVGDATSGDKNDFDTNQIEEPWGKIADFIRNFEKEKDRTERLFPERFEWWPKIIKIIISGIRGDKEPTALIKILTKSDCNSQIIEWTKKKLQIVGSVDPMNPVHVLRTIDERINNESMIDRNIHDPEIDMQKKTYMEVVGHFYDSQNDDDEIKKLEITLIKEFLGCNRTAGEEPNKLHRWSEAQFCARRRFLEREDCYEKNQCRLPKVVGSNKWENRLYSAKNGIFGNSEAKICDEYLDRVICKSRFDFNERLRYHSCHKKMGKRFGVVCLRRWQSYTPALSAPQKVSRGGGYFVFQCHSKGKVNKGVVIDPGIYFLENFIEEGFSIQDIDAVLLTHSHIDHRDDLESILTLIHEAAENEAPKNIKLIVTKGSWDDIGAMIRRRRQHIDDIYTIEDNETTKRQILNIANPIMIRWEKAYHECFDADCVGYHLWNEEREPVKGFRFTGDTVYPADGLGISEGENVVMLNLGGLVSNKKGTSNEEWTLKKIAELADPKKTKDWALETGFLEDHLYLAGALQLLCDWKEDLSKNHKTGLAVLCELPEELSGGHRKIIAKAIQEAINNIDGEESGNSTKKIIVLPEDVGLRISYYAPDPKDLKKKKNEDHEEGPQIECLYCSQLVNPEEIEVIPWGLEERLMFVCRNCRKAAAPYLLEEKFKNYRDRGRPFERAES